MNARTGLFTLKTTNGKHEKWRETRDHVVVLPFAFAVNAMLNLSNITFGYSKKDIRVYEKGNLKKKAYGTVKNTYFCPN